MVKAYLKYVQHDIVGGLAGNQSNIITCQIIDQDGNPKGTYIVSACNEVINFSNTKTGEIEYKIYDKEATFGYVTQLQATEKMIAIGFSTGTIQIYELRLSTKSQMNDNEDQEQEIQNVNSNQSNLKLIHQFSFHRSSVTQIIFYGNDTYMATGSMDTYVVVYDLIYDTASFKLLGHNEAITSLGLFKILNPLRGNEQQILISGSKDGLMKFWDIEQQSCILNLSDQYMSKIEGFTLIPELQIIAVGSSDNQIRLFQVSLNKDSGMIEAHLKCNLRKDSNSRVININYDPLLNTLTVISSDNKFEIFKVNTAKEESEHLIKKMIRLEKRKILKRKRQEDEAEDNQSEEEQQVPNFNINKEEILENLRQNKYDLSLHFSRRLSYDMQQQKSKIKSIAILQKSSKKVKHGLQIFAAFHSNHIYQYSYDLSKKKADKEENTLNLIKVFGEQESHKLPIRNVQISQNDSLIATSSFDCTKVWAVDFSSNEQKLSLKCQASINYENVLSLLLLPGNKHILLGTKEGNLGLYDLQTNECIHEIAAHQKEIWELTMHTNPQSRDARGSLLIASGSADKSIKFWTLTQSSGKERKIQLQLYEKIETTDEVMGIKITPDGKYFVFSLLDQTMKVCYLDSMKLSLNLYGHKLPILSFDISSDNSLLVSASADKNIKIWGMDFGDIHKSIFAHQDSITCVKFIRETHYILSCSKDKEVKMYDGDTYDEIFVFDNFFGEVWSLTCSSIGDFFVAVSADKCMRIWIQTQEQVFVDEEREKREEKLMLKEAEQEFEEIDVAKANQLDPFAKDKVLKIESAAASKKTAENLKYGENLMEALELSEGFKQELEQYEIELDDYLLRSKQGKKANIPSKPKPNLMFNNRNIFEHIILHLKQIRIAELENTLRFLNFRQSAQLLFYLEHYIRNDTIGMNIQGLKILEKDVQAQIMGGNLFELSQSKDAFHF